MSLNRGSGGAKGAGSNGDREGARGRGFPGQPLLNAQQVAEWLGISKRSVLRLAASGRLPAIHLGSRLIRFEAERVEQWLKNSYSRPRRRRRNPGGRRKTLDSVRPEALDCQRSGAGSVTERRD